MGRGNEGRGSLEPTVGGGGVEKGVRPAPRCSNFGAPRVCHTSRSGHRRLDPARRFLARCFTATLAASRFDTRHASLCAGELGCPCPHPTPC
eukprot:scaffold1825_cov112-Isochrysis_galbana.AAC.6